MSFCLYELAKAPEIQAKVHSEIDAVLKKHNGQLTYDAMNEMKYLENCIDGGHADQINFFFILLIHFIILSFFPFVRNFEKETTVGNASKTMHSRLSCGKSGFNH